MRTRTSARGARKEGAREPERRTEIVAAAYAEIAEKGLEGLRTRDIAARAGVNISTLHYYFGTKEALIVAVLEHVRDHFTVANRAAPPSARPLRAHLDSAWRSFQATPHLSTVLQELALRGQRDPSMRAAFKALHAFWSGAVEDVLREGIRSGELRADIDVRAAARIVTSFVMGAMTQLSIHPRAFEFAAAARELERWLSAG